MTDVPNKPLTPRQALIKSLDALPAAVREETLRRLDSLAPRGPDDDDEYHDVSDEEFVAQQEAEDDSVIVTELDDSGNERPATPPVGTPIEAGLGPDAPYTPPVYVPPTPSAHSDEWVSDFGAPGNLLRMGYLRIDSPRYLLGRERYIYKPLDTLEAARESDNLTSSSAGKALVGFAITCQKLYTQAREQNTIDDDDGERVDERAAYEQFVLYVQAAYEQLLGEAGKAFRPYDLAFKWIELCDVRRVPLPSNRAKKKEDRDNGGPLLKIEGVGDWRTYYNGRHHTLVRLAGALMWESLGDFCTFLQCTRG